MTNKQAFRYETIMQFVAITMRGRVLAIHLDSAISSAVSGWNPFPAIIGATLVHLGPKSITQWFYGLNLGVMTIDESLGLSSDPTITTTCCERNWCWLSTSTHAKTTRIRHIRSCANGRIMSIDKSLRLTLDPASFGPCVFCYRGGLSAATFTEFCRGVVRGMLLHVDKLLSAFGQSRERVQARCSAISMRFYQSIIPQVSQI